MASAEEATSTTSPKNLASLEKNPSFKKSPILRSPKKNIKESPQKLKDLIFNLIMKIYYKNSYSIISYSQISTKFLNISPSPIKMDVGHPENFDIFRSGVFPMKFKFNSPFKFLISR